MTDALKIIPSTDDVSTGVRDTATIASGLADVLSDTYRLVFKTHAYHWNVEGPLFYSVHKMTEEQYENMFAAADELAERIRALGELAPMQLSAVMERSRVQDGHDGMSAFEMIEDLAADHEKIAHRLHALVELVESRKDPVTEDLATERSAFHEQAAWMLRALTKS
ncbi:ferritin Dps family protein (plasmid) [Dinoroseobacter shibae DFL 12 = DSM 16493]|jgi:starvation-inducible DNA-binding protein|uniref:Ferritin Dps family protein n=1 Tax=Dinoroseobacter shibae (strain DSM 16493 / NCIMB 14021 / DFL 12) TaxID=398580 RepID=A8LTK2_DINSH|nr:MULTISPECIES: DNA starvation/stationary phase protection protein [Dinoroseobacter]ABV95569.1 ferritin Dps family protein [Dinoroseobacter shibae DFL 12 = DSM 16493]MDD9718759.1 DNA starvation/stationary phase protection protein [Dinoroseobacter sp. PD6]URF48909.1 DNA starvation/stationary phase protection protein [Dinoroseobacter shibae]URF53221.1 DNA starvation/stationary phase protection protein [Dinoroseobacter shibae]